MADKYDPCGDRIKEAIAAGLVPDHPIADGRFVPNPVICVVNSAARNRGWSVENIHDLYADGALKLRDMMAYYQQIGYTTGGFEEMFGDHYLTAAQKAA